MRMLRRSGAKEEKDGRVVADWEVAFERALQPCKNFGLLGGKLVADAGQRRRAPLHPFRSSKTRPARKIQTLRLRAIGAHPGSALVSPEGLRLLKFSVMVNGRASC